MKNEIRQSHWENVYQTKALNEVSWFQHKPETSLAFLTQFNVPITANIIDVGGGDSLLVDHLLDMGYENITVLDISATALERAKTRLGQKASLVKWIVADAASFEPTEKYDFWHDRAAFHFLTKESEIIHYLNTVHANLTPQGIFVLGTFSEQGPQKCSGLNIVQYTEEKMSTILGHFFDKVKCITVDHKTPFNTVQNFIFCSFKKANLTSI